MPSRRMLSGEPVRSHTRAALFTGGDTALANCVLQRYGIYFSEALTGNFET